GIADGETPCLTFCLQQCKITLAVATEAEIIPHHQVLDIQPRHQHLINELLCRSSAQGVIELHAQHPVYASGKQGLNFFPQTHQARGRLVTGKKLMWLGLKYDDHRGQLMRFSSLRQLTQYRLVTEMNAVKRADGGDTAAMP